MHRKTKSAYIDYNMIFFFFIISLHDNLDKNDVGTNLIALLSEIKQLTVYKHSYAICLQTL